MDALGHIDSALGVTPNTLPTQGIKILGAFRESGAEPTPVGRLVKQTGSSYWGRSSRKPRQVKVSPYYCGVYFPVETFLHKNAMALSVQTDRRLRRGQNGIESDVDNNIRDGATLMQRAIV